MQEQCLLTLSIYSSLKFNFSKLCMEGVGGNSSAANISFGGTFQNHSGTASSKVDQVPTIVLTQDVQEMQTIL